ncbi:MAG: DUF3500 domain-containing protein [Gemmatimonadota bacterium]
MPFVRPFRMVIGAAAAGLLLTFALRAADARAGARVQQQLEAFTGVTTNGQVVGGLFTVRASGVSTEPVVTAGRAFLAVLTPEQRARTSFDVDADEWRLWNNVHRYRRQGVSFLELSESQRTAAWGLLQSSLSARGFDRTRNIMRLNGHLADVLNRPAEYGEYLYNLTVMGAPSPTEPWGWQLDGHHLIINYFVLGDQVVMTPTFMGSEPVSADSGRFAGITVMQEEQDRGLALMQSLNEGQRQRALIASDKTANVPLAHAFRDNAVIETAGLRASELDAQQRALLLALIEEYVGNMATGHARVRMDEVSRHIDDTHFAWIGGVSDDAVFYYRIQSPVLLIEFDHQSPVALDGPRGVPTRRHVHSVVRTPNGNDYGKDLLRQHYELHRDDPAHGHRH